MLRTTQKKSSWELKKIGRRLIHLCSKNPMDGATADAALAIIREHQHDHEVINARLLGKSPLLLAYTTPTKLTNSIVQALLETSCVDVTQLFPEKRTFLHIAAMRGDDIFANMLLAKNAIDINARDKYGCSALIYAATNRNTTQVAAYLKFPHLLVNTQSKEGSTALINALTASLECAELLLQDPRTTITAVYKHNGLITNALCTAILSQYLKGSDVRENRNKIIRKIINKPGTDLNCRYYEEDIDYLPHGDNGCTPLMLAAARRQQDVVRILLDAGADCSLHNDKGETAEQCARHDAVTKTMIKIEIAKRANYWPRCKDTLFARSYTAIACQQHGVPKEVAARITQNVYVDNHPDNKLNYEDKGLFAAHNQGIVATAYAHARKIK